jgi:hypothetical protein
MIERGRRHHGVVDRAPEVRLKMHFRLLADGVVLAYADPRSAEWAAFEAWSATPGNIVEIAPDAAGTTDSQAA